MYHSSKVEFVCSFFGRNIGSKKSFRLCLTFILFSSGLAYGFELLKILCKIVPRSIYIFHFVTIDHIGKGVLNRLVPCMELASLDLYYYLM